MTACAPQSRCWHQHQLKWLCGLVISSLLFVHDEINLPTTGVCPMLPAIAPPYAPPVPSLYSGRVCFLLMAIAMSFPGRFSVIAKQPIRWAKWRCCRTYTKTSIPEESLSWSNGSRQIDRASEGASERASARFYCPCYITVTAGIYTVVTHSSEIHPKKQLSASVTLRNRRSAPYFRHSALERARARAHCHKLSAALYRQRHRAISRRNLVISIHRYAVV